MACKKHGYTNNVYCPACDLEAVERLAMPEIDHDAAVSFVRSVTEMGGQMGGFFTAMKGSKQRKLEDAQFLYVAALADQAKRLAEALEAIAEARHPSGDQTKFADASQMRDYACAALASYRESVK